MVRLTKSQAVEKRQQKARFQASRSIRHRPRDARAAPAAAEVQDGNTEADRQRWEDARIAFERPVGSPSLAHQQAVDLFHSTKARIVARALASKESAALLGSINAASGSASPRVKAFRA